MKLEEFQKRSTRTMNTELDFTMSALNMCCGLSGETGEVVDLLKKVIFQGHKTDQKKLAEEIGDVFFYLVNLCTLYGLNAEEVIEANYNKLLKRYPEGFDKERSVNREK